MDVLRQSVGGDVRAQALLPKWRAYARRVAEVDEDQDFSRSWRPNPRWMVEALEAGGDRMQLALDEDRVMTATVERYLEEYAAWKRKRAAVAAQAAAAQRASTVPTPLLEGELHEPRLLGGHCGILFAVGKDAQGKVVLVLVEGERRRVVQVEDRLHKAWGTPVVEDDAIYAAVPRGDRCFELVALDWSTGACRVIASGLPAIYELASDTEALYVVIPTQDADDASLFDIQRFDKRTGVATRIVTHRRNIKGLGVHESTVVWLELDVGLYGYLYVGLDGYIYKAPKTGGAVFRGSSQIHFPSQAQTTTKGVYVATMRDRGLHRSGHGVEGWVRFHVARSHVFSFLVDDELDTVYVAEGGLDDCHRPAPNGTVKRIDLKTGTVLILASNVQAPSSLTVTGPHLYWVESGLTTEATRIVRTTR